MLILASQSPRRRRMLEKLGVEFVVVPSDREPAPRDDGDSAAQALESARVKAERVARRQRGWVLAADTIVDCDGRALGKPESRAQAADMLALLSGRRHRVTTAVVLLGPGQEPRRELAVTSQVEFRELDREWLEWYLDSGEYRDKAGAYGIQGLGAALVRSVQGSYTNVVGLPLAETLDLLCQAGLWRPRAEPGPDGRQPPGGVT